MQVPFKIIVGDHFSWGRSEMMDKIDLGVVESKRKEGICLVDQSSFENN